MSSIFAAKRFHDPLSYKSYKPAGVWFNDDGVLSEAFSKFLRDKSTTVPMVAPNCPADWSLWHADCLNEWRPPSFNERVAAY
jgi:hypothetical protein